MTVFGQGCLGYSWSGQSFYGGLNVCTGLAVQVCYGYSMNAGRGKSFWDELYGNVSLGVGLGAALNLTSGEKVSKDALAGSPNYPVQIPESQRPTFLKIHSILI